MARRVTVGKSGAVLKSASIKSDRFSDLCPPDILKGLNEMELQRQETIYELVKTEKQYVVDMELVVKMFLIPIREKQLLPKNKLGSLFSNIETLLPVNQEILKALEHRQSAASVVDKIGDIFLDKGSLFKLYAVYCSNQSMVPQQLAQYQQESETFAAYLKECSGKPECRHMLLSDFLIEPLQRICKYPLLLRAVLKNTPEHHEDYGMLQSALEKVESVVEQINDRTRQVNNVQKLSELKAQLIFEEEFDLVTHGRYFVKQVTIKKSLGVQVGKSTDLKLFLFNDVLLLCTDKEVVEAPKQKPKVVKMADFKEFSVKRIIPLFVPGTPNVVRVECLSNTGLELCEVHEWPYRKHVFLMDCEAERDGWANDIKKFTDLYLVQYEKDKQQHISPSVSSHQLSQMLKQGGDESAFPGIRSHDEAALTEVTSDGNIASAKNDNSEEKKKEKKSKDKKPSKFSKVLHRASVGLTQMSTSSSGGLNKWVIEPLPERTMSSAVVPPSGINSAVDQQQIIDDMTQRIRELEEEVFNVRLELKGVQKMASDKDEDFRELQSEMKALKDQVVYVYRLVTTPPATK